MVGRTGIVSPLIHGRNRAYRKEDVFRILLMCELRNKGISLSTIRLILENIKSRKINLCDAINKFGSVIVVADSRRKSVSIEQDKARAMESILRARGCVVVVALTNSLAA